MKRSTAPPPEGPALGERLDVGPSRAAEAGQAGEEKSDRGKYATAPGGAPSCVGGFFPGFLADCKAIVHFVRQYRVDLKHDLNRLGQSAAASIVEGAKSPKFAHWRWTTLYETVKCVQAIYPVLQTNWENIQCKDKIRDQGPVNKVDSALRDADVLDAGAHATATLGDVVRLPSGAQGQNQSEWKGGPSSTSAF